MATIEGTQLRSKINEQTESRLESANPGATTRLASGILAIIAGGFFVSMLGACDSSNKSADSASASASAEAAPAIPDSAALTCSEDEMVKLEPKGVSWATAAKMCQVVANSLGHAPSAKIFRDVLTANRAFSTLDVKVEPEDLTYQLMNIAEARGISNDADFYHVFDVTFRCSSGTSGHVTPKDLLINLRAAKDVAKTMSDDGVFTMCAMIQQSKKDKGE